MTPQSTRKRIEYRYCDSNHTAILLIRTDVTDQWNEEQARVAKLQQALELAYTDLLTKLMNYRLLTSAVSQDRCPAFSNAPQPAFWCKLRITTGLSTKPPLANRV